MNIISRVDAANCNLQFYFTGKPCHKGHVCKRYVSNHSCFECRKIENRSDKKKAGNKEWYRNNREHVVLKSKEWYLNNKEHSLLRSKKWTEDNKERYLKYQNEYQKEWRLNNREKVKKYRSLTHYKINQSCRRLLQRVLEETSNIKTMSSERTVGYSKEDLLKSIESKFLDGMSWDNHGEWHIDHIYPVSRYVKDGVTDPSVINALDNLIPMWKTHNLNKHNMTMEEFLYKYPELCELYKRWLE